MEVRSPIEEIGDFVETSHRQVVVHLRLLPPLREGRGHVGDLRLEADQVVDLLLDLDLVRLVDVRLVFRTRVSEEELDDVEHDLLQGLDDDGVVLSQVEVPCWKGQASL